MTFRTGDRVYQRHYGVGEIIDMNADHVTIAFDDGTARKFASGRVQLQPSAVPRPARSAPAPRSRRKSKASMGQPDGEAKTSAS
jgi:hypothetical protein